jgi:hypothetical protein
MKMQGEMMQKCKFTKSQCEKNCAWSDNFWVCEFLAGIQHFFTNTNSHMRLATHIDWNWMLSVCLSHVLLLLVWKVLDVQRQLEHAE